jgi:hypothetical protein
LYAYVKFHLEKETHILMKPDALDFTRLEQILTADFPGEELAGLQTQAKDWKIEDVSN